MSDEQLKQIRNNITSEEDFQAYLEQGMEGEGWDVLREVSPDHSNDRADLIGIHPDIGWIGIECKYLSGGPVVIGEAIQQILSKYAGRKYLGHEVDMWGIAVFGRYFDHELPEKSDFEREQWYHERCGARRTYQSASKRIANGTGLGWVTANNDRVLMEFSPSPTEVKIPLFEIGETGLSRYYEEVDIGRIKDLASRKPL